MRPLRVRVFGVVATATVALGVALTAFGRETTAPSPERGENVFRGHVPVTARLAGQDDDLPVAAVRCTNCHEAPSARSAVTAGNPATTGLVETPSPNATDAYAVTLNNDWLSVPRSRRGGPASVYTDRTLCAVLNTGVDPAHVMIPTTMPRYALTPEQCADLWAYLQTR